MKAFLAVVALAVLAVSMSPTASLAETPPTAQASAPDFSWQDKLQRRTGEVVLPGPHVKLMLGEDYYFLGADESRRVLTEGWGNPPAVSANVLGMIFPARFKPIEDGSWGVVISFEDSGYVSDKDAAKIDPTKLLTELRSGEDEANAERTKAGYETIHLANWAEAPSYHPDGHYVIWAQDLQFGAAADHTLNYDIRMLGRRGVLSLNVVAGMSDLAEVRAAKSSIVKTVAFEPGSRYADFDKSQDKVAEYGVAGLVAAGLGAAAVKKLGLLGIILAFGKKALVLVVVAFGALAAWARRFFGGGDKSKGGGTVS